MGLRPNGIHFFACIAMELITESVRCLFFFIWKYFIGFLLATSPNMKVN